MPLWNSCGLRRGGGGGGGRRVVGCRGAGWRKGARSSGFVCPLLLHPLHTYVGGRPSGIRPAARRPALVAGPNRLSACCGCPLGAAACTACLPSPSCLLPPAHACRPAAVGDAAVLLQEASSRTGHAAPLRQSLWRGLAEAAGGGAVSRGERHRHGRQAGSQGQAGAHFGLTSCCPSACTAVGGQAA